jgi:hypothetical protein
MTFRHGSNLLYPSMGTWRRQATPMKHFCAALRALCARSAAQKDIVSVTFGCDARLAPEPVQRDALNDRLPIRWLP